jgi:hypothetical protein
MHAQCGKPSDEYLEDWKGIAWTSQDQRSKRLSGNTWDFWLIHGCEKVRPSDWDLAMLVKRIASGEWPVSIDISHYATMVILLHGREPILDDCDLPRCIVNTYTHTMSDESQRLRVLYTLYSLPGIDRKLIDEIGRHFAFSQIQVLRLREVLGSLPPLPSFRDVVHLLSSPVAGLKLDLQTWQEHRDDASRGKLVRDWYPERIQVAFRDMRGFLYQKACRNLGWDTTKTIERFVKENLGNEMVQECWDRVKVLLPAEDPITAPEEDARSCLYWKAWLFLKEIGTASGISRIEADCEDSTSRASEPFCQWNDAFFAALDVLSRYYAVKTDPKTA